MGDSNSGYEFGSAEEELARLELQGRALAPATRMIFTAAGIQPGMRVLDVGCGAGDVAFVTADLVGPEGSVVGVDRSPEALARARLRAEQRGLAQVQFVGGDIHDAAAVALLAGIIHTAAPLIERTGVATAEEIGADTFAQRLTAELQMNQAVFAHPILLSAWATND